MTAITTDLGTIRAKVPPIGVYVRHYSDDEWLRIPGIECDYFEFGCQPTMPEATLRWRYGRGMLPGEIAKSVKPRTVLQDWRVKIVVNPDADPRFVTGDIPPWYGRIVDVFDERRGYPVRNGVTIPTGVQTLIAHGLEVDLDSVTVDAAFVLSVTTQSEYEIDRALPFNAGTGDHIEIASKGFYGVKPNRSSTYRSANGAYVFTAVATAAEAWSSRDIIEYLLAFFSPSDNGGETSLPYWLTPDLYKHLDVEFPKIDPHGRTVREVLSAVMDRRRGIGWYLRPTDTTIFLETFTLNDVDIPLDGGRTIPANPNHKSIDFDASLDVLKNEVRLVESSRYDRVVIRGARIGAVMTLSTAGGGIVKDWTDAQKTIYNEAAIHLPEYAAMDVKGKQDRNDAFRKESQCARVYSWFCLAAMWDGRSEIGTGTTFGTTSQAFCRYDETLGAMDWYGTTVPAVAFWRPGLRFQRELPLLEGVDYSGDKVPGGLCMIPDGVFSIGDPTHTPMAPLVAIALRDDAGALTGKYEAVHHLASLKEIYNATTMTMPWSASVKIREDDAGFELKVAGSEQHVLAKADFVPCDDTETGNFAMLPRFVLDWSDNILATVYVLQDRHHEVWYPEVELPDEPATDRFRVLTINVPEYHLDYVARNTVVDIKDRTLVRSEGGIIRNHTKHMRALANMAGEWYCKQRKTLTLQYRQIRRLVDLGDIITQIGCPGCEESIRTCVTRIRYDMVAGTTTIQTQYAELDARVF